MDILLLLIPLSVVLVLAIAVMFAWSVRSGQFDDLEAPAWRILADDDGVTPAPGDPVPPECGADADAPMRQAAPLTSIKAAVPGRP